MTQFARSIRTRSLLHADGRGAGGCDERGHGRRRRPRGDERPGDARPRRRRGAGTLELDRSRASRTTRSDSRRGCTGTSPACTATCSPGSGRRSARRPTPRASASTRGPSTTRCSAATACSASRSTTATSATSAASRPCTRPCRSRSCTGATGCSSFRSTRSTSSPPNATSGCLDLADSLLLVPDLIAYQLTGAKLSERTNASTTGLVGVETGEWDDELIARLGLPASVFAPLVSPGESIGGLRPGVAAELGAAAGLEVVAVGSHDTASAVVAVPMRAESAAYISCGTWGLVGVELEHPVHDRCRPRGELHERGRRRRARAIPAQRHGPLAAQRVGAAVGARGRDRRALRAARGRGIRHRARPGVRRGRPAIPGSRRPARRASPSGAPSTASPHPRAAPSSRGRSSRASPRRSPARFAPRRSCRASMSRRSTSSAAAPSTSCCASAPPTAPGCRCSPVRSRRPRSATCSCRRARRASPAATSSRCVRSSRPRSRRVRYEPQAGGTRG